MAKPTAFEAVLVSSNLASPTNLMRLDSRDMIKLVYPIVGE